MLVVLQRVREELVHLGDAGRDAEVDGSVTDLNDKSTNNLGVNLVGDLELLALADVGRLGDGSLQSVEGSLVESLSAGNSELNLTAGGRDDGGELLNNTGDKSKSVVLGEGGEEVLDGLVLGVDLLLELLDDGLLVGRGEGRGGQDGGELGVLLDESAESVQGIGSGVDARGLDGGSVQSSSICAINAEDGNRGLDFGRGSGSERSDGGGSEGEGSLRSGDSGGAENLCEATTGRRPDSVKKRERQNDKHRIRNHARKAEMRTRMKKVLRALEKLRKKPDAQPEEIIEIEKLIAEAYKAIDKTVKVGAMHRNTANHRKSRLARRKKAIEILRGWYVPNAEPVAAT